MRAFSLPAVAAGLALAACQPPAVNTPEQAAAPELTPTPVAEPAAAVAAPDPALAAFLETYARDAMAPLRYVAKTHDDGENPLTLVYLIGPEYCGSGGCNLLILRRSGESYASLGETSITRPPIRVLETETNGLPDIGVHVSGGGITEGYEARLAFDGDRYPRNPSVAPAQRVNNAEGTTLITEDDPGVTLKD